MRFRLALNSCLNVLVPGFRAPLTQPFCQLPANKALASHLPSRSPHLPGTWSHLPHAVCFGIGDPGLLSHTGKEACTCEKLTPAVVMATSLFAFFFLLLLLFLDFSQWMEVVSLSHHSINPVPGHGRFLCFLETAH